MVNSTRGAEKWVHGLNSSAAAAQAKSSIDFVGVTSAALSSPDGRHPEVPRFHQRDEGSCVQRHSPETIRASSLRRLKYAAVRDGAVKIPVLADESRKRGTT